MHGRALGADDDAPTERAIAGVEIDADANGRQRRIAGAAHGGVDQLELGDTVDHHRYARAGQLGGQPGQLSQCGTVGRRVGDEDVLEPMPSEPQSLREREGERTREPLAGQHAFL